MAKKRKWYRRRGGWWRRHGLEEPTAGTDAEELEPYVGHLTLADVEGEYVGHLTLAEARKVWREERRRDG
jgi:hypothetical protein